MVAAVDVSAWLTIRTLLLEPAAPTASGVVTLCVIDPLTQTDHSKTRLKLPDDAVLVVDGVFALRPELNEFWDLRIWLEVDPDVSLNRGIRRDARREGIHAAEALHRGRYGSAETLYIAEVNPIAFAEVVIDNSNLDHPLLVRD